MVRSVLLWEVVRSIEEHSLLKKLKAEKVQTLGKRSPSKRAGKAPVLQAAKQERLAVSTAERFNLEDWLAHEPHADFLSLADADAVKQGTEEGKMTSDVSRYLDSKTSRDLDTWLARETMGPAHEKGDSAAHDKSDSVLGKWLDRHASVNLGRWMQSFSRETTPLRARANARLAHRALAHEEAVLERLRKELSGTAQEQLLAREARLKDADRWEEGRLRAAKERLAALQGGYYALLELGFQPAADIIKPDDQARAVAQLAQLVAQQRGTWQEEEARTSEHNTFFP